LKFPSTGSSKVPTISIHEGFIIKVRLLAGEVEATTAMMRANVVQLKEPHGAYSMMMLRVVLRVSGFRRMVALRLLRNPYYSALI
jgi:hypothetical protein